MTRGDMDDKQAWAQFMNLCLKVENQEMLDQFFDLFLTVEEKNTLASRYKIIKSLFENKLPQRTIAIENNVSIAQITRGSNALKRISPEVEVFLKKSFKLK